MRPTVLQNAGHFSARRVDSAKMIRNSEHLLSTLPRVVKLMLTANKKAGLCDRLFCCFRHPLQAMALIRLFRRLL
ncbi:MAG: hypothetical protein BMS9Abin26_1128 [Gammaproteobacteria bacterium]|nr:MAG: hypothetical protein BMS9Abin26_1128 [Gammaproteobacteria bacterium]